MNKRGEKYFDKLLMTPGRSRQQLSTLQTKAFRPESEKWVNFRRVE